MGIPSPDKKDLSVGIVARPNASGRVSYAVVLKGDLNGERLKERLVARHANFFKKRNLDPQPSEMEVAGQKAVKLRYTERPCCFVLVPMDKYFVIASTPNDDFSLAEEVWDTKDPSALGRERLPPWSWGPGMQLTDAEKARVKAFKVENINGAVKSKPTREESRCAKSVDGVPAIQTVSAQDRA